MVPNIFLEEEEEDGFYHCAGKYDMWDNNPYTDVEGDEMRGSHTFIIDNSVFNLTKTKRNKKLKTRIVSEVFESNNKSNFFIDKRQS